MKIFKLVGLALAVWGLGLLWPEVHQFLLSWVAFGIISLLGAVVLALAFVRRLDDRHGENGADRDHPTHPMPVGAAR